MGSPRYRVAVAARIMIAQFALATTLPSSIIILLVTFHCGVRQMHIKEIQAKAIKRFSDLQIKSLPPTARLIVLTGPNGCGKSSVLELLRFWHQHHATGHHWDPSYYVKAGEQVESFGQRNVNVTFHETIPSSTELRRKLIYVRSAYRNQPDFVVEHLRRKESVLGREQIHRLIDNDTTVADNYERLVSATVAGVYDGGHDRKTVPELRDMLLGQVRKSMSSVFGDLLLAGPGDPLTNGSFYFEKGTSKDFHYKNLSGGEKPAFDLILDIIIKRAEYDDTIYAIDEPESHMNSRLQGRLLEELLSLIPGTSQLWIATHSVGMLRKAKELKEANPDTVVFLDFDKKDFDKPVVLMPAPVNRRFWLRTLDVALDDLAPLVAPRQVVVCEGMSGGKARPDFDAECYRNIFSEEYCDTDFISGGNASDVEKDRLQLARSLEVIHRGLQIIRLVDRDDRSDKEMADQKSQGVRILSRRNLESYLLDDEIIDRLCVSLGHQDSVAQAIEIKKNALADSQGRGNAQDDLKSARGQIYNGLKTLLALTQCGSSADVFLRDTMAPLITPDTRTYQCLKSDIFG
jgi:predicted ATPase